MDEVGSPRSSPSSSPTWPEEITGRITVVEEIRPSSKDLPGSAGRGPGPVGKQHDLDACRRAGPTVARPWPSA